MLSQRCTLLLFPVRVQAKLCNFPTATRKGGKAAPDGEGGAWHRAQHVYVSMQAAKAQLDKQCATVRGEAEATSAQLQEHLRAAVEPATLAQLRQFVETASTERESLKRSLTAAAKVRASARLIMIIQ